MDKIKIYKEEILKWLANDFIEGLKNGERKIEYFANELLDNELYNVYSTDFTNKIFSEYYGAGIKIFINCKDNTKGYIELYRIDGHQIILSTNDNSLSDGVVSDLLLEIIEYADNGSYENFLEGILLSMGYDLGKIKNLTKNEV